MWLCTMRFRDRVPLSETGAVSCAPEGIYLASRLVRPAVAFLQADQILQALAIRQAASKLPLSQEKHWVTDILS